MPERHHARGRSASGGAPLDYKPEIYNTDGTEFRVTKGIEFAVYFKQIKGFSIIVDIPYRKDSLDNKIDRFNSNFDVCIKIIKVLGEYR